MNCWFCSFSLWELLIVFSMGLFGAAHWRGGGRGGSKKAPFPKSVISYNDQTWWFLPKEDPKIYKSRTEICNFCYIKKYIYRLHFNTWFLNLLTLFESLKTVLINMVAILMMSAKLATPGLLKMKIFWNKGYA